MRQSPARKSAAAAIRPRARIASAVPAPAVRAVATSTGASGPTAVVTRRSPRSVSCWSSRAGRRVIAGWPGRSTTLAIRVAAASACRRGGGEDGDGVGDAEGEAAAAPAGGGDAADRVGVADGHAVGEAFAGGDGGGDRLAGGEVEGDVAAVVHVGAVEVAGRGHRGEDRVGDGAGDGGHRGDERRAERGDGLGHRPGGLAGERARAGGAEPRELGDELVEERREAGGGAGVGARDGGGPAPGLDDQVDGAVLQVQAAAVGQPGGVGGHRSRVPAANSPPVASTSSRLRIASAWPPSAR